MSVEVSVAVVHHPSRHDLLELMLDRIDLNVTVCEDEGQGPIENSRRAWCAYQPNSNWHLVVEDDLWLCEGFRRKLKYALEHVPDPEGAVSLFGVAGRYSDAFEAGNAWYVDNGTNWAQALLLPTETIPEFIAWEKVHVSPRHRWFCQRLTAFCQASALPVQYTLPMMVDHVGAERSLVGNPKKIGSVERRASCFMEQFPIEWFDTAGVIWRNNHKLLAPESLK